jgi:hypothetical protein
MKKKKKELIQGLAHITAGYLGQPWQCTQLPCTRRHTQYQDTHGLSAWL